MTDIPGGGHTIPLGHLPVEKHQFVGLAGRIGKKLYATAPPPTSGVIAGE